MSTTPNIDGVYPPPDPAPALDDEFLFSCLPESLQNDIPKTLNPMMIEELQKMENKLLNDISQYLNDKIVEFFNFTTHLVLNGKQEEIVHRMVEDELAQARKTNHHQKESPVHESPNAQPAGTESPEPHQKSSPSTASLDSNSPRALHLKSSLAKPKDRKKSGYSTQYATSKDGQESSKKKKVMFSNNDQITIVPSIEDLEQEFISEEDEVSDNEEVALDSKQTTGIDPSDALPPYSSEENYDEFDDEFNSSVAVTKEQFTPPVYSDSTYSSGLDSPECSPESTPSKVKAKNDSDEQQALNEFSYPKPTTHFHTYEETVSDPAPPAEASTEPPITELPKQSPVTEEQTPSYYEGEVNDDNDDDDDVFQFDETLGVMPDAADVASTTDSIEFLTSKSAFRSQFSSSGVLPTNYHLSPSAIPASLPSNQSRTSMSQLPTVVGSLRPKPMNKYRLEGGSSHHGGLGHHRLPPISGSGSNSLASSLSSNSNSNSTLTPTDRPGGLGRALEVQRANGISKGSAASQNMSNFASSLPIQISSNNTWGRMASAQDSSTSRNEESSHHEGAHNSLHNPAIMSGLSTSMSNAFLTDEFVGSVGKDFVTGSNNHNGGTPSIGLIPEDPILEEDLALYNSPSSALPVLDLNTLNPDQMSFSQRMMFERRGARH